MNDTIYVVVYVGYEGIGALLWAGPDKGEAIRQTRRARAKIKDEVQPLRANKDNSDAWLELPGNWSYMDNPDRICVMVPDFDCHKCVCKDLGVSPKEPVFY